MGEKAKEGDAVSVEYTGTFEDGTKFDSTEGREPLEFTLGSGQVIPGFEGAIVGLSVGEEIKVTIPPEKAYGPHHDKLVQSVSKNKLPADIELKKGTLLTLRSPTGQAAIVKISDIKENEVVLDLNHPLAGKTLSFKIKLVSIKNVE